MAKRVPTTMRTRRIAPVPDRGGGRHGRRPWRSSEAGDALGPGGRAGGEEPGCTGSAADATRANGCTVKRRECSAFDTRTWRQPP